MCDLNDWELLYVVQNPKLETYWHAWLNVNAVEEIIYSKILSVTKNVVKAW